MQIEALHQQRPPATFQRRQCRPPQRPGAQRPAGAVAHHQTRFDLVVRHQIEEARTLDQVDAAGDRLAHQQRLLLPVAAHENLRRKAAQQRARERNVHG
jgi:hypothetical protein